MTQHPKLWKALTAITLTASAVLSGIHLYPVTAESAPQTQQTSQAILTLSGHTAPIRAIAIDPDGQIITSGGDDKHHKQYLKTRMDADKRR